MNFFREPKDMIRPTKSIQDFLLEFKDDAAKKEREKAEELELTPEEAKKKEQEKIEFISQQSINRWSAIAGLVGPRALNKG